MICSLGFGMVWVSRSATEADNSLAGWWWYWYWRYWVKIQGLGHVRFDYYRFILQVDDGHQNQEIDIGYLCIPACPSAHLDFYSLSVSTGSNEM